MKKRFQRKNNSKNGFLKNFAKSVSSLQFPYTERDLTNNNSLTIIML